MVFTFRCRVAYIGAKLGSATDLEAINALNVALQGFEGTILLVTHDQDLIEEVGTRVWHFEHGEIRDFKGPYEEYAATLPA